jgi:hypothetical protein
LPSLLPATAAHFAPFFLAHLVDSVAPVIAALHFLAALPARTPRENRFDIGYRFGFDDSIARVNIASFCFRRRPPGGCFNGF